MLREIATHLWVKETPARFIGLTMNIRMTAVRLADGGVWLHSPVPLTDEDQRQLDAIGPVKCIVAPSKFHHLHARAARERFPAAKLLGAPGLPEKRRRLAFDGTLSDVADPCYASDLQQVLVGGMPMVNEVVFFHPASRTLILTDFLFNVREARGWWPKLYFSLAGRIGEPCQSLLYRMSMRDRAQVQLARDRMLAWDFDRIVLSHGDLVLAGGKAALRRATAHLG